MSRHLARHHSSTQGSVTPSSQGTLSRSSSSDRDAFKFEVATAEVVREATLCMIRKTDGLNTPAMSHYLRASFPSIPEEWHMPMIVAAFTAAQKAAAMHVDTLLKIDDQRKEWAQRSLARWGHGLSAVERRPFQPTPTRPVVNMNEVVENLLVSRELPVPLDSEYATRDVERVIAEDALPREPVSNVLATDRSSSQTIDISSIMDNWGKVGEVPETNCVVQNPMTDATVPNTNQECHAEEVHPGGQNTASANGTSASINFSDILLLETGNDIVQEALNRTMFAPLSPLMTPRNNEVANPATSQTVEPEADIELDIHASPRSLLEEESPANANTSGDNDKENLSSTSKKDQVHKSHESKKVRDDERKVMNKSKTGNRQSESTRHGNDDKATKKKESRQTEFRKPLGVKHVSERKVRSAVKRKSQTEPHESFHQGSDSYDSLLHRPRHGTEVNWRREIDRRSILPPPPRFLHHRYDTLPFNPYYRVERGDPGWY